MGCTLIMTLIPITYQISFANMYFLEIFRIIIYIYTILIFY